ncbi:hypothetical protein ACJ6WE_40180, partial [Streptomyces sp. MMS24-I31]
VAVTPHEPSRDAVLAAPRCAIDRRASCGPAGGLPSVIRVDRGKEFLCRVVTGAMGGFAVGVCDLPAYSPHLEGTVEALNNAVEEIHFVVLPRMPVGRNWPRESLPIQMLPHCCSRRSWRACWPG